jgi:hypothetical protein
LSLADISLPARQADIFSTALISSSAPAAQNANAAGADFARALASKPSKSTLSTSSPCLAVPALFGDREPSH